MRKLIIGSRDFERRKLKECAETGDEPVLQPHFTDRGQGGGGGRPFPGFIISTASVDRYGDTVAVDGWKLANFRKNPVVLWMHDNSMLPGRQGLQRPHRRRRPEVARHVHRGGPGQIQRHRLQLLKTGFLTAVSVGFIPLKYNFVDDPARRFGIDFLEQELLEFSIVTVPANAEALVEGRATTEQIITEAAPATGHSTEVARRRLQTLRH
jgi:HK97 family phage prohead protease